MQKKRVVVIGGGTGTHTVLQGLKKFQDQVDIAAVVTMADSGGSTGRLRDEFGQLPVGDVRMALAALARDVDDHEELLRELFLYRFDKGEGLNGHNFGNLLLVALSEILGSEEKAIQAAAKVLRVQGSVFPVTTSKVDLVAQYADGVTLVGEHEIDEPAADRFDCPITQLSITPASAFVSASAKAAILQADLIVLGPGDVYTSVLANVVIGGVAEAICTSNAKIVHVCNLMTKAGQTLGMGVVEHIAEMTRYVGKSPDVILVNNGQFPADLLKRYAESSELPVVNNTEANDTRVLVDDFLATEAVKTASGDVLKRSLIRHDSHKLAQVIVSLL